MGNCFSAKNQVAAEGEPSSEKGWKRPKNILGGEFEALKRYYAIGNILGTGRYGLTQEATCVATGEKFVCKSITKRNLKTPSQVEGVKREIAVLKHLRGHENIVAIERVIEDVGHIHILMEHCDGENIQKTFSTCKHHSEKVVADAMKTILSTVAHLHSENIMHRNIEPDSFIMCKSGKETQIKMIRFGYSTFFQENEIFEENRGNPLYVAPEVIKGKYGCKSDVWSCGILLFTLLSGLDVFSGVDTQEIFCQVTRARYDFSATIWKCIQPEAQMCVMRMLERLPQLRATAVEMLKDPWLAEGAASDSSLNSTFVERMQTYLLMNPLKKETLKFLSRLVPQPEVFGARELFFSLDTENSGYLCHGELKTCLRQMGTSLPDFQLNKLIEAADANMDGVVDYDEFVEASVRMIRSTQYTLFKQAFKYFDTNCNGYLSLKELTAALGYRCRHHEEILAVMEEVDKNKDGRIDFGEYIDMLLQGRDIFIPKRDYAYHKYYYKTLEDDDEDDDDDDDDYVYENDYHYVLKYL